MSADSIVLSRSMRSNSTATASDACHDRSLRFLNLPPELRIFVYTELLPLRQKPAENQTQATRKHCYPEIRRACHLVHKEALDVLFSTEIQLSMALVVCESEAATRAICKHPRPHSICGSVNGLPLNIDKTTKLFTSPSRVWPAIISNIPKLRLLIDMCTPRTIWLDNSLISSRENEYSWQLNHLLYDLSNFLEWGWPNRKGILNPLSFLPLARELRVERGDQSGKVRKTLRQTSVEADWMAWLEASCALQRVIELRIEVDRKRFLIDDGVIKALQDAGARLEKAMEFEWFIQDFHHNWHKRVVWEAATFLGGSQAKEFDRAPYVQLVKDAYVRDGKRGLVMD